MVGGFYCFFLSFSPVGLDFLHYLSQRGPLGGLGKGWLHAGADIGCAQLGPGGVQDWFYVRGSILLVSCLFVFFSHSVLVPVSSLLSS